MFKSGWLPAITSLFVVCHATAAAGPADEGPGVITVAAVGDLNLGSDFPSKEYLPPDEGRGLLEQVKHLLRGQLVFANLEGPLADGGSSAKCPPDSKGCYAFRTPTALGERLREAGFTAVSIANNHAMDFGQEGRDSTRRTLDLLGIAHSGPPGEIAELELGKKKAALIAFAPYDHSHDLRDIERARQMVSELAARYPLVIVSFHGGSEGANTGRVPYGPENLAGEPRGEVRRFARAMIDAGASLVLGHGPHVLRGLEQYRGKLIAYSLGNFCTFGRFNISGPLGVGMVLEARLDANSGRFLGGRIHSTVQTPEGPVLPDPQGRAVAAVRELSQLDFPLTAPVIKEDGTLEPLPGDGEGLLLAEEAAETQARVALLDELVAQGFDRRWLLTIFGDRRAQLVPDVLQKFARPTERLTYQKYRQIFVTPEVLQAGAVWLQEQKQLLDELENRYQVERFLLAGLVAVESRFGSRTGTYPVFNALVTVALQYPRRAAWAKRELGELLRVFQQDPLAVNGSYAGAVGLVQFMPSSIRKYGVDYDGDGRLELNRWPDALASAANYLRQNGYLQGNQKMVFRALHSYNPSVNYVRVILELAQTLGKQAPADHERNRSQSG